ncbi:MAG: protein kinase [Nitrospirae bacterium]|nr:protein kinase [Nitrospirota bacterium]
MERFGQYILLEKVATGGMAELFKAKKLGIEGFERVLAIKRILPHLSSDEEFIEMFIAEAKLVARLGHKSIAQVYDFGKIGQSYFIAMEYIRGKDLRAILKKCKERKVKFPIAIAVFIAKDVASGLSYAHRQKDNAGKNLNIIHRDVSPQNILISYDGDVKVVDFGIAKAEAQSKTTTGVLKGKLSYMSPEQAWGRSIDHRSDIFALGIVLYEMLTGERLFRGDSELNTLERVRAAKVEPIPSAINTEVPAELEARLFKALAKEVGNRYQNASEMEADLGKIVFKLLRVDPAIYLKQFMQHLFKTEIEAEHKSEMEKEAISITPEQESIEIEKPRPEAPKPAKPKPEEPKTVSKNKASEPRRNLSPFVIATAIASVIVLIIAAFMFWPLPSPAPVLEHPTPSGAQPSAATEPPVSGENPAAVVNNEQNVPKPQTDKEQGKVQKTADEVNINIPKGKVTKESHKFGEGFGTLVINASPWGNVYMDGDLIGQTPLTIEKVPAGRHKIRITKEGYTETTRTVEINEGAAEQVSFSLHKE